MEFLDCGHLPAFFGDLEAIGYANETMANPQRGEQFQSQADPAGRECLEDQRRAVEDMQQPPIGLRNQPAGPDEAGHAGQVGTNG
jgi:hypothetical protein